ncbi:MAG: winged helix-turn-helix domain-containing protein [Candidatus Aenigmarchaeota archaeon]|nr:winged helix-turn-helix domain-containing protein [Candidatus Aenigmarchaeota archaeon]
MDSDEFFGAKAGKVWKVLHGADSKTLTQLQKSTGLTLKEVSVGLGWLAREGKIRLVRSGNSQVKFKLVE